MLVISSTVYNEIPSDPTIIVVPVVDHDPDTAFGVPLDDGPWAAPGLVTSLARRPARRPSRRPDRTPQPIAREDLRPTVFRRLAVL